MGYPGWGRGAGCSEGGACRGVIGWQEKIEAAGVEAGETPWSHHEDRLGVVVEGGDAG